MVKDVLIRIFQYSTLTMKHADIEVGFKQVETVSLELANYVPVKS